MNREIKFRCWHINNKEMINFYTLANEPELLRDILTASETIGVIPMQYTGLKDKNGKDVFEGDVLRITSWSTTFKVVWDDYYAKFTVVKIESDLGRKLDYIPSEECEIIGNIYENPELLTK